MRIKRAKIPLDVILATPVSEHRKRHGKQVFATRLCKNSKFDEALAYCVKNNLDWPPFSGVPAKPISDGAHEAGPVAREEATPPELVTSGVIAPSEPPPSAGIENGGPGEPVTGVRSYVPHETSVPAVRRAKIWSGCPNPRLVRIKFEDGDKEFASLWVSRGSFKINEPIDVVHERGTGENAIWQEKRRAV